MTDQAPRFARIEHFTLFERVYGELRAALLNGRFVPGQALTIRGIAEEFGTSMMPVREALQRLAAERAVEIVANRSICIPMQSKEEFEDLVRVRVLLEGHIVSLAAAYVTDSDIEALRLLNKKWAEGSDGDFVARTISNREFHFGIYRLGNSPLLFSIIETLWLRSGPCIMAPIRWQTSSDESKSYISNSVAHHRDLLDALAAHDPDAAARAVQRDITDAAQTYLKFVATAKHEGRPTDATRLANRG